jgi:hypothetical protein
MPRNTRKRTRDVSFGATMTGWNTIARRWRKLPPRAVAGRTLSGLLLVLCTLSCLSFHPTSHHHHHHHHRMLATRRTKNDKIGNNNNHGLMRMSNERRLLLPLFLSHPGRTTATRERPTRRITNLSSLSASSSSRGTPSSPPAGGGNDDEAEWKAVLAAFRMYKAAYGDLKVPQRFVVPNMKPWPVPAHNLKLGKVVANIRATGRYVQNQPARRMILEELGFIWRVRDTATVSDVHWEQVLLALQMYRELIDDDDDVPGSFSVPELPEWPESVRGLPLGRHLALVRSSVLPENAQARELFAKLGVFVEKSGNDEFIDDLVPASDFRFQRVYAALEAYRELYGDLLVPQPFVVPSNTEWPKETWGLRLGARVNAIRSQGTFVNNNPERREMLDDLGFVWIPPKTNRTRRGRRTQAEIEKEEALAPEGELGSVGDAASDLGAAAMDSLLEGSFMFDQGMFEMDDDGVGGVSSSSSWNLEGAHMPDSGSKSKADAGAADEDYLPPRTFADSLREAAERAMECGVIEGMTETNRVIKGKREKDIPWFNDDFGDDFVFEDVVEALSVYKSIYGDFSNLTTGSDFVVPTPKELTGFLDDDGFDQFEVDSAARAAAAIARYPFSSSEDLIATEIRGLQNIPGGKRSTAAKGALATGRTADMASDAWPEHLAGMSLASVVQRMREGSLEVKHLPKRKAMLDALDFDWGDDKYFLDVPFEKAMCAMYAYYLVRGDMFVYEDFVMPGEDPWPQALAGYEIGKAVRRLRELQNFLEAYHPEKVSLLRMIDFVWFSDTVALPMDPDEAEETSESLLLSAFGHPDFSKMIDIPMGLPDKIIAEGPFVETNDDPKLWWRQWHNWDYVKDYWYQNGRRDNGYVLRAMGYPKMADEHEAKYGPGLFSQINESLRVMENGIESMTAEEKQELLERLNFFRKELLGCTDIHPQDRDQLVLDLDAHMLTILEDPVVALSAQRELANAVDAEEYEEVGAEEYEDSEEDEEEEYEDDDEEYVFDVENELGLDRQ